MAQHYVDQHSLQLIDDRDKIQLEITKNEQYGWEAYWMTCALLTAIRPLRLLAKECSTLICKPFAAIVYNRLPRELRDQVYDLLWTDEEVDQLDQVIGTSKDLPRLNHWSDPTVPSERAVPFFADADFTGPEFAHEAAVWYFKMRTRGEIHYSQVRNYIERNEFGGVKLAPINFIRRLTINLEWVMPYADHLSYADLRECMESLLTLKDKKRLAIEIYLSRDMQFSRTMFQALELIRPFFLEMKGNGFPPKLMGYQWFSPKWRQVNPDRVEERKTYATVELLNYFFDGTPEEWLAMKSEEIQADENHTRRKKCFQVRQPIS